MGTPARLVVIANKRHSREGSIVTGGIGTQDSLNYMLMQTHLRVYTKYA